MVHSRISALFFFRCPLAVLWAIWAVVVHSVECQIITVTIFQGPVPKGLEVMFPLWAYLDPTAAVIVELDLFRIITTTTHVVPYTI